MAIFHLILYQTIGKLFKINFKVINICETFVERLQSVQEIKKLEKRKMNFYNLRKVSKRKSKMTKILQKLVKSR